MAILMGRESTGGAVARKGFAYQDAFVLQSLPMWLSQSAFSHVVSEAIGDVELCYHRLGGGVGRVFCEAKDHPLTATDFWHEVCDFKRVFDAAPADFKRFWLVCKGYNSIVAPLLSMLERLRGVGSSFDVNSVVLSSGRQQVVDWVVARGQSAEIAEFVLDFVDFVTYAAENVESTFIGNVEHHLPMLNLRTNEAKGLCAKFKALVERTSSAPVYRRELEGAILETLGTDADTWRSAPTAISIASAAPSFEKLGLAVGSFAGPERGARTETDWAALTADIVSLSNFIKESRTRPGIALDGKQRMSLACLLGFVFSATRGFILDIEHNGAHYRTDNHNKAPGAFFAEALKPGEAQSSDGVVSIGIPAPVGNDIDCSVTLGSLPQLSLYSARAIEDEAALNLAVAEAKAALVRFRIEGKFARLHLVIKAPSFFSMALGHRLNGVGPIQLYDWIEGAYQPTAALVPS